MVELILHKAHSLFTRLHYRWALKRVVCVCVFFTYWQKDS